MTETKTQTLDPQTFGSTMGNAVWLMTMDKRYRDRPIREIEALVATPILLRSFKLYSKDKQPVAFLTWASVSDVVKAKVEAGEPLALEDWRSGENLVVVDVVSPFAEAEGVRDRFLDGANAAREETTQAREP
ncbi:cyclolysin-activating lysine-acyltransferase CyaC [Roseovarius sp. A-2]|uniref:toxin-activating lysine-acyltransferase n=1 Tax=Roseovarius sp. A-2 TaxID=1570360 RepID=UPI0009B546B9|nr:toxin-activating lysine-acyltransferase [Roseovarius sp. A-2]GAW35401.1 cyclolysin-activating lysine-acyltransferase CyaC [Roseovarius sp. A-2]